MIALIERIRQTSYSEANSIIRTISGIVDYFSSDEEKEAFISTNEMEANIVCDDRVSYGDWQTPIPLAEKVCEAHLAKHGPPDVVIEPTCGIGAFVLSALKIFPDVSEIHALEINRQYAMGLKLRLLRDSLATPPRKYPDIYIYNDDFFDFDFSPIIERCKANKWELAVIGNPPWVTNSRQGKNHSANLPVKRNKYGLKGIDAITGKSNFDISEYITLQLLKLSELNNGGISFLLKNSVIRNILVKQHKENLHIGDIEQIPIDAQSEFSVSVDASFFSAKFGCTPSMICSIRNQNTDPDTDEKIYGWVGDSFVSDLVLYNSCYKYDKSCTYVWRSGIKHDCAPVLELTQSDGRYVNGFGEVVVIENDMIYPLLKSSDINNYQENTFRKYIIVPQRKVGDNTAALKYTHPLAYSYLTGYESVFSSRKSSIYKGKDKFSIFGIGEYSFSPYKIVVSSLYKTVNFVLVPPYKGRPVMLDDTCYQLGFDTYDEAKCIYDALQSPEIRSLLESLIFKDAKRVVTKGLLMRLDLAQICRERGIPVPERRDTDTRQQSLFD